MKITTHSSSGECLQASAIAVGHIPYVDQEVSVSKYVYLDGNGTDLFYPIAFLTDCSGFTVSMSRIYPRPSLVDMGTSLKKAKEFYGLNSNDCFFSGDTITFPNWTIPPNSYYTTYSLLVRTKAALPLISIVADLPTFAGIQIYPSNDNFQFSTLVQMSGMDQSTVWDGNTDTLDSEYLD